MARALRGAVAAVTLVSLAGACTFEGAGTAGAGRPTIALLLPESKTARYETQDRPRFQRRVRELCPSCRVPYANAGQEASVQQSQAEAALINGARVLVLDPVDGDAVNEPRPLVALLGQTLTAFTLDHEKHVKVPLPLRANVLRVIDSGVVRIRDLPGQIREGIATGREDLERAAVRGRIHAESALHAYLLVDEEVGEDLHVRTTRPRNDHRSAVGHE